MVASLLWVPQLTSLLDHLLGNRTVFGLHLGQIVAKPVVGQLPPKSLVYVCRQRPASDPLPCLGEELGVEAE